MKRFIFSFLVLLLAGYSYGEIEPRVRHTAIYVSGAYSLLGSGAELRVEHAFSRYVSIIVPLEYRFEAMSMFAESSKFNIGTAGVGTKFYFSQLFWSQQSLRGFFIEGKLGAGYAHQSGGHPLILNNKGITFVLGAALGYSHAFDCGLFLTTSLGINARSYLKPIVAPPMRLDPLPELSFGLGYSF